MKLKPITLKLGNLLIAISMATVPTAMTIGFLLSHGYIVCRKLDYNFKKL